MPAFALFDPFKRYGHPWLGPEDIAALYEDGVEAWPGLPPDEPVDVTGLCRRIRALERALQDLEGNARRLARWRARRDRESLSCPLAWAEPGLPRTRPRRWSVMRPGRPPGWTYRPKTPVEAVLHECHALALDAWNTRAPPASVSAA